MLPAQGSAGHRHTSCSGEVQDPCSCLNYRVTSVWTVTNRALWHLCVDFQNLSSQRASYQLWRRWVGPPEPHTLWFDYVSCQDKSTRLLIKPLGRAHAASGGGGVNVCEQWSVPVFLILIVSISGCTQRGANLLLSRVQAYVPLHIWIMCQPHNITCYAAWHQVGP